MASDSQMGRMTSPYFAGKISRMLEQLRTLSGHLQLIFLQVVLGGFLPHITVIKPPASDDNCPFQLFVCPTDCQVLKDINYVLFIWVVPVLSTVAGPE